MLSMGKIVPVFFGLVGIGLFLMATNLLQETGKTELMGGALFLIPSFAGVVGGMFGRRKLWKALFYGCALAFLAFISMFSFLITFAK